MNVNMHGLDKKTYTLIKQLLLKRKDEPKKFTNVDEDYLQQLLKREIDYNQIQDEKERCRESVEYFIERYIWVKNKFENPDTIPEILKARVSGDKIKFNLYDIQKDLVTAIFNDDKVISTKSRQIGFTTTALACALQLLTFNNNKTILLFSKSEKDAKDTLTELKFMYDNLPFFLRRNEYKRNEKELVLGAKLNSSKIIAQTTGRSSGRSHAATWLICDEADYINGIEEIYKAALFTIAATKGKIIVLSTPNLHGSQFQRMVKGAKEKQNGFTLIEGEQQCIPWRTQDWYDEQCRLLNHDKKSIATELDMRWILPYETYFEEDKLLSIKSLKPISLICGSVQCFHYAEPDQNYLITVDCQEEGKDYNAIVVLDLNDRRIHATMKTRMDVYDTLLVLSKEFNNAKIIIERNRGFHLIKKFEENNLSHLLLPNIRWVAKTDKYEFDLDNEGNPNKLGFVTIKNTRNKLLLHLSDYFYKCTTLPADILTEAETFIIKRGKPQGLDHDDLIMATGIGLLTAAVIEETRELSKSDRKLMKLIDSYQGKSLESAHRIKQRELKQQISEQLSTIAKSAYMVLNPDQYSAMVKTELLRKEYEGTESKLGKALKMIF